MQPTASCSLPPDIYIGACRVSTWNVRLSEHPAKLLFLKHWKSLTLNVNKNHINSFIQIVTYYARSTKNSCIWSSTFLVARRDDCNWIHKLSFIKWGTWSVMLSVLNRGNEWHPYTLLFLKLYILIMGFNNKATSNQHANDWLKLSDLHFWKKNAVWVGCLC